LFGKKISTHRHMQHPDWLSRASQHARLKIDIGFPCLLEISLVLNFFFTEISRLSSILEIGAVKFWNSKLFQI